MPITDNNIIVGYYFNCPGCKSGHAPYIRPFENAKGASWGFNCDLENPTFTPSILSKVEFNDGRKLVCHLYLTDGRLHFLDDCTHELAGQIVDLPEL